MGFGQTPVAVVAGFGCFGSAVLMLARYSESSIIEGCFPEVACIVH